MRMLLPGYDSKEGNVNNMSQVYESVMMLLEKYTSDGVFFKLLPAVTRARGEERKTRIMLYYHICAILDTFDMYADTSTLYDTSNFMKNIQVDLDIDGFWNECDGTLDLTTFWEIDSASNYGSYFVTCWHKNADNKLTGIRYVWFLTEGADGNLVVYIVHPEAIKRRMKGEAYTDADNVWYSLSMPDYCPDVMPLKRIMPSKKWESSISLTRVSDKAVIDTYEKWMDKCTVEMLYEDCDYTFINNIYAVTIDSIYIPSEVEGEFFKVPKDAVDGFDKIQIGDNVGIMQMNGQYYIVFDEFMLYIKVSKKNLKKYGIKRVNTIE